MYPLSYRKEFERRLYDTWLPSFCAARGDDFLEAGFRGSGTEKLSEFDAYWFLQAVQSGYVSEHGGFFSNDRFASREQIFSSGSKGTVPRVLTLWIEPIITIGAIARLIEQFGITPERVGAQSEYPWPFDLAVYVEDQRSVVLTGEVKKARSEIVHLIDQMAEFGGQPSLTREPTNQVARNSYRKVVGIRKLRPKLFWALGPSGLGHAFRIDWTTGEQFTLHPIAEAAFLNLNS